MGQLHFAAVFVHALSTASTADNPMPPFFTAVCVSVCAIKAPASWEEEEKQALAGAWPAHCHSEVQRAARRQRQEQCF